jgi:hypothetical protein
MKEEWKFGFSVWFVSIEGLIDYLYDHRQRVGLDEVHW